MIQALGDILTRLVQECFPMLEWIEFFVPCFTTYPRKEATLAAINLAGPELFAVSHRYTFPPYHLFGETNSEPSPSGSPHTVCDICITNPGNIRPSLFADLHLAKL